MIWLFTLAILQARAERHPTWLDAKIQEIEKSGAKLAITRWRFKGRVVYVIPKRCCDIPTEVFTVGGERICELGGGFANVTTPECADFARVAKRLAVVWTNVPAVK